MVYALCKYRSLNLQKYCQKVFQINYNNEQLKKILNFLDSEEKMEILIGSGFAELINENDFISRRKNRGNNSNILKKICSQDFFRDLKHKGIKVPQWSKKKPMNDKYLIKNFKSFGGAFIKNFKSYSLKQDEYFQKKIYGEHLSIQFFVLNKEIKVLTICNQYFQNDILKPFLIKSIITKKVNSYLLRKLSKLCKQVSEIYNLNGINNLDLILELETEKIYIVELNGRPGLSTNLIYKIHRNIYKNFNFRYEFYTIKKFFGTQIIYSNK